ncbi:MAG: glycosyltransferase [Candidatus Kapaibacteriales bacterium]
MSSGPIKICHFLGHVVSRNRFKELSVGGAEIFVHDLIKKLGCKKYHHIIIYASKSAMTEDFKSLGCTVIEYNLRYKIYPPAILHLARIVRLYGIDIMHSHAVRYDFTAMLVSKITGIPLVITRHVPISDYLLPRFKKVIYQFFDWFSLIGAKIIIAISADCRAKLLKNYFLNPRKIHVIYCGIDTDKFSPKLNNYQSIAKAIGINRDTLVVGTIAQLRYYKGIDLFIKAVPEVLKKFQNTIFLIVGDGPERNTLEKLSRDIGVEKHVKFLGLCKDISSVLRHFDIFVLPSRREGLPLSILEAMYFQKPIIATDVGAIKEIVKPGETGFLIKSENIDQIVKVTIDLLSSAERRIQYGINGYQLVTTKFSILNTAKNHDDLYSKLTSSR